MLRIMLEEVESDVIYVGRIFSDKMNHMILITHTCWQKGLESVKAKPLNS